MDYLWMGLAGGAASFAHCLGMCGGFALHLSRPAGRRGLLARQMLWHGGKTTSYVFLGALAGFVGGLVGGVAGRPWIQTSLAFLAGGVMVLAGLALAGLLPRRAKPSITGEGQGLFAAVFRQIFAQPGGGGAFVLGLATGLLPCPIVAGFLLLAFQSGSVPAGLATMAAFGAGTVWSLLLLAFTGQLVLARLRRWGPYLGATVLVLLGLITMARGMNVTHQMMGCPHGHGQPASGPAEACGACQAAAEAEGKCCAAGSQPATGPASRPATAAGQD